MRGYDAFLRAAAWCDLSARGRLEAKGEDRARLIHAIASNAVEDLAPGRGVYAFFLDAQGRIQADSHIFVDIDRVLIDCEPATAAGLREHIESYIVMDDVSLEDRSGDTALLGIAGPRAAAIAADLGLRSASDPLSFARTGERTIYRAPLAGTAGYWIEVPVEQRQELVAALEQCGAVAASEEAREAHRVRNRVPRFGVDFSSKNIPHETQQMHAVSFTKGCYTGQEIVERVRSRGRVQHLLVSVEMDAATPPMDLTVRCDGSPVGALTSPTPAIRPADKACGFAIVRSSAAAPGTAVAVGPTAATVREIARA